MANSVAQRMDSLGRLAASFRFDRSQAERTPDKLIGNLCRQLAHFNNSIGGAILAAEERHGPGGSMTCASEAAKLLVAPMLDVDMVGPIVIVIDALDESGKDYPARIGGGTNREDLVTTIVTEFIRLPASVKVLINTSREEGCITALMPNMSILQAFPNYGDNRCRRRRPKIHRDRTACQNSDQQGHQARLARSRTDTEINMACQRIVHMGSYYLSLH